jgi:hypothetical protein
MKYLKILVLVAVVALVAWACKKSFLDKAPIGSLDPTALANKNGVEGLLIGAYSELDGIGDPNANYGSSSGWASSADDWVFGGLTGGEAHKGSSVGDQPEMVPIESFDALSTNPNTEGRWDLVYDGVSRCNDVIRTAALASDISATDLANILGQARALRAWYHFDAKKHWNNIPFVDETVTYGANNYFVPNDQDAWPKIEADLQFAVANVLTTQDAVGRINKYTAEAILAKVYMFEKKYDDAKPLLADIIGSGKYALNDKFHDNFSVITKNSSESVFAAQSSVNDGSNGNNGNYGVTLNFPYGPAGTCCGFDQPTQWLVDHFKTVAGLPDLDHFDDAGTGVKNDMGILSSAAFTPYTGTLDPRLDWTVGRRGIPYLDWGLHPGNDWIRAQTDGGPYAPKKNVTNKSEWKGFTDAGFWQAGTTTAINVNLIRYADVLLWAAECEVNGTGGSLDQAETYVNMIRNRMVNHHEGWLHQYLDNSNPGGGSYTDDAHLAANYVIMPYPAGAFTSADFANKAIQFERLLELGMENHRFFDLVRWGTANTEITRYLLHEKTLGISYIQNAAFTPGKTEYFPIPQTEIDKSNGTLKQNPGY